MPICEVLYNNNANLPLYTVLRIGQGAEGVDKRHPILQLELVENLVTSLWLHSQFTIWRIVEVMLSIHT